MPRPFDRHRQTAPNSGLWVRLAALALIAVFAGTLSAQTVPTGVQEYFILGWEQHIWDMMDRVQNGQGGAQFDDGMNSVVTATASADMQVIYYDHWEDGVDAGLVNFPDTIGGLQTSTLVIGDGDPSNGDACDFNSNLTCGTDLVSAGDYINFNSDRGLVSDGATVCAKASTDPAYTQLCNSVEVNPRCAVAGSCLASEFRFDGGDLALTSGGPLAVIHSQYPLTNFIGGSTEILSRQAVEAARSYSVPIGEDLYVQDTSDRALPLRRARAGRLRGHLDHGRQPGGRLGVLHPRPRRALVVHGLYRRHFVSGNGSDDQCGHQGLDHRRRSRG